MSRVKITSSILPEIYPNLNYKDVFFEANRPIKIGKWSHRFKTNEEHELISDDETRNRNIQVITADKYELTIFGNEDYGIDLIDFADSLIVELEDGTIHDVEIIEFSEQEKLTQQKRVYKLNYIDLNSKVVSNFLKEDFLLKRYSTSDLLVLTILRDKAEYTENIPASSISYLSGSYFFDITETSLNTSLVITDVVDMIIPAGLGITTGTVTAKAGGVITLQSNAVPYNITPIGATQITISWTGSSADYIEFNTSLRPKTKHNYGDEKSDTKEGIIIVNKSDGQDYFQITFFMSENDKNNLVKYLPLFDCQVEFDSILYNNVERVIPDIEEDTEMVDCYKCIVNFKYTQRTDYRFV